MKTLSRIQTAVRSTAVVILTVVLSLCGMEMNAAKSKKSIFPDFAYPKDVKTKAEANLKKAAADGNWNAAVTSAIQLVTADNLVSDKNAADGICTLDSLCNSAPAKWKPAFLLIQAQIYRSLYTSMRWEADSRRLPLDSFPSNPYDWSRDMFAVKTYQLCDAALAYKETPDISLAEWSSFLDETSDALSYGVTVNEFIARQSFDLLGTYSDETQDIIPFFPTSGTPVTPMQRCAQLRGKAIDSLIAEASKRKQSLVLAHALADKTECLTPSLRMKSYLSDLETVKDSEGSQLILQKLQQYVIDDNTQGVPNTGIGKRQYVDMLRKSVRDYPKGRYSNALRNIISDMTQPYAEIEFQNQYLTSDSIRTDVKLTNCNEAWFLVYDYAAYADATEAPTTQTLARNCRLIKAVKASVTGTPPFKADTKVEIGRLPLGTYVIVPSSTPNRKGIFATVLKDTWRQRLNVSDISVMTLRRPDGKTDIFVIDGADGRPIQGATVKVYSQRNYRENNKLITTLTTDRNGSVRVTEKQFEIKASHNGSKWESQSRYYNSTNRRDTMTRHQAQILADRALCHPGDSIKSAIIGYTVHEDNYKLTASQEYNIALKDANGKEVSQKSVTTDEFGRATADFAIPTQGLLGSWSLTVADKNGKILASDYFQVADYVAPTFFITTEHSEDEVNPGDVLNLKGQVLTYSGMPIAGADVKYHVTYNPPMRWWFNYAGATYDSSVTTDAEGKYEISLPTANLKNTQFERGIFTISLSATSPAGETQSGPTERFAIGQEYSISISGDKSSASTYSRTGDQTISKNVSDGNCTVTVNAVDMLGRKVNKKINYKLSDMTDGKTVAQGEFESPSLQLPVTGLPSAKYDLRVALAEDSLIKASADIILWKDTDKTAPAGTGLWVPQTTVNAEPGKSTVNVTIGNGKGNRWIPIIESGNDSILSVRWVHIEKDNVAVTLDAPSGNTPYSVNVNSLSDLAIETAKISIQPATSNKIIAKTITFRDNISAGDRERWTFEFTKDNRGIANMPAIAVMTDASLNAIAPFKWNFAPASFNYTTYYTMKSSPARMNNQMNSLRHDKYLAFRNVTYPYINDYNQQWGLRGGRGFYHIMGAGNVFKEECFDAAAPVQMRNVKNEMKLSSRSAKEMAMPEAAEEEAVEADAADDQASGDFGSTTAGTEGDAATKEQLRDTECPVAFFKPYLNADSEGRVSIDFTVPNFNTTWALQVIGYDSDLQAAKIELEAVASKPIMVSAHAPRFVRTGDEILLTATIFNNSGEACDASGRIELVDLIKGTTIGVKEFASEKMGNAASRQIEMLWTVPTDVSAVAFRAYAESDTHRDGEQALLTVLPASSPVVESTPFWIAPGTDRIAVKLPTFKNTDRITLQYCDNPAWYCLTALPDIVYPDSKSITAKMRALYGNAMAYNLISSNANLETGLQAMLSDTNSEYAAIKSNLEKDGNLKITELNNTPWVNDAASETLRMSRLSTLLQDTEARATIKKLYDEIKDRQTPEGGWSWCPDMQPSPYITRELIRVFGMMMKSGAVSQLDSYEDMVKSAIAYVDSETLKDYRKYHQKNESLSYLLDWLYIRNQYPASYLSGKTGKEMSNLAKKAITDISAEWKVMGIGGKAKASVVLWRAGYKKDASAILESIRQYASESPEKGIWFDNLQSGLSGIGTIGTTTLVLEAFAEILPHDSIIDGIRQWLILGRQIQEWNETAYTVETVNAILTSGSDWTKETRNELPQIYLKGKKLELPMSAAMTGSFTMTLDAKEASKKELKVSRSASGPAWGGVVAQYESPIMEVKPSEVPELSIRKNLVALEEGADGSLVTKEGNALKKGMMVRVTLTITVGRDMDYVALTDERSACLEPVEQLSGYAFSDGLGFYREVRDANTNLFFDFLPKGNHVISYDCRVSQEGDFSCGIATIQSQYSPLMTAHSSGAMITVK